MDAQELRGTLLSDDVPTYAALMAPMSREDRVRVVTTLLEACVGSGTVPTQVTDVLRVGRDTARWIEAHAKFDALRDLVLVREAKTIKASDPSYAILFVAENAARVIYNATNPVDPFDDDSSGWFLRTYVQFAQTSASEQLIDQAIEVLERAMAHAETSQRD